MHQTMAQGARVEGPDVEVTDLTGSLTPSEWRFAGDRTRRSAHGFLLDAGMGEVWLGQNGTTVRGPCVIWLPGGVEGQVRLEAGARGAMLSVSDGALARVVPATAIAGPLREGMERPLLGVPLEGKAARAIGADIAGLSAELFDDLPGMREAVMSRLCLVLIAFWRLGGGGTRPAQSSPRMLVQGFLQLVELNARRHWRVADYAAAMGITTDRLNTAIKRASGVTPLDLVHRRLLEDAEALLERSSMQVGEVADALGFRDAGYFSRFFSQRKGISPGRFRQQAAQRQGRRDGSYAAWP
ncbi:helix-turn-helix domain-containing protein [Devosia sp. Root685]|uniref:helix-turn-helix domain-containing protein n=1 Tax=Devosia sp. Root685 TaxID=1736587 RepID=UPI000A650157|nr:helix-turn-helix domain-containing protein [Devosia sp. Root685]